MLLTAFLLGAPLCIQEPALDPAQAAWNKVRARFQQGQALHLDGEVEIFIPPMDALDDQGTEPPTALVSMGVLKMSARIAKPNLGFFRLDGALELLGQPMPVRVETVSGPDGIYLLDHEEKNFTVIEGFDDGGSPAEMMSEIYPLAAWMGMDLPQKTQPKLLDLGKRPAGSLGLQFSDPGIERDLWFGPKGRLLSATLRMTDGDMVAQRLDFRFKECTLVAKADANSYARKVPEGYQAVENEMDDVAEGEMPDFESGLLAVGDTVPTVALTDMNGKAVRLADYRGKTVLLNFWFYH